MTQYPICPDCGAVCYGNLTCRTCRQHMRQPPADHIVCLAPIELLDILDAADIPTIPPVGAEEIQRFLKRLESA